MANEFFAGVETAQKQNEQNPFNIIANRFLDSQARRYKEDQTRKSEEADLFKSLQVLNKDYLYKQELAKVEAEDNKNKELLKAGEERKTGLFESLRKGEVSPTTETGVGTFDTGPFGVVGKVRVHPKETAVYLASPTGEVTKTGAIEKGGKVISAPKESSVKETGRISRENLYGTINKMESLLKDIPSKEGISGRFSGLVQRSSAMAGYNEKLQTYNSFKQAILGQIVKTIGGETGSRLSDQDVKRMAGVLPSEFSTTKERELKLKLFKQMVNDTAISYGAQPMFKDEQAQGGKVTMKDPSGKSFEVDASEAEEALKHGWTK